MRTARNIARREDALVALREVALRHAPSPLGAQAAHRYLALGEALRPVEGRDEGGLCRGQLAHESRLLVRLYCEMERTAGGAHCQRLRERMEHFNQSKAPSQPAPT